MNISTSPKGFLIVEEQSYIATNEWSFNYKGMYRVPPSYLSGDCPPEKVIECEALDLWFADDSPYFSNENKGLIPSFQLALELYRLFQRSRRKFEIIYCEVAHSEIKEEPNTGAPLEFLGYDVAPEEGCEYWSLIFDYPTEDDSMQQYLKHVNKNTLFDSYEIAEQFRNRYIELKLMDWFMGFVVWRVFKVLLPEQKTDT